LFKTIAFYICGRDFHLAHMGTKPVLGSWVAVEPNGTGPYLHYALQGLELSSHHPVGLYSDTKRYNLKY